MNRIRDKVLGKTLDNEMRGELERHLVIDQRGRVTANISRYFTPQLATHDTHAVRQSSGQPA